MEKMKSMAASRMCNSKTSILYKAFYFVFYAGYISFLLYVPVYFKYLGLSAIYVGLLNGIRPLMQTIGAPFWGVIGDRFRIRKVIFIVAFVVMTVKTMLFLLFRPENTMCVVTYYNSSSKIVIRNETYVIKHDITKRWLPDALTTWRRTRSFKNSDQSIEEERMDLLTTAVPLNAVVVDKGLKSEKQNKDLGSYVADERTLVKNFNGQHVQYKLLYDDDETTHIFYSILLLIFCGEAFDAAVFTLADTSCLDTLGSANYGYYRLWGSAGWGIISPIIGFLITQKAEDNCGTSVGSYFIIFYFYLAFMYLALLFGSHFEFSYTHNDHVHQTVKSALLNFHYGIFLFVTFYAGVCYGFLLYFVNWFIDSIGGTAIVMGTATACKSIMDVFGFFLSGRIIDTLGHLNTVTISLMAYIVTFVSYSYMRNAWYAVPIEVLHAGAYALVWSSSVSYLNKAAPAGSSATVQGILQGVYWGLGTGGGTIVGGYVVHVFGLRSTFRGFAVVTAVVLAVFLTTQLISKYSNLPQENGKDEAEDAEDINDETFLSTEGTKKRSDEEDCDDDEDDDDEPISGETWKAHWQNEQEEKAVEQEKEEPEEHEDSPKLLEQNGR